MLQRTTEDLTEYPKPASDKLGKKSMAAFFPRAPLGDSQPALIQFSSVQLPYSGSRNVLKNMRTC